MSRRPVFLSFCYDDDVNRVQQIRNMGLFDGQQLLSSNDFETVKRKGEAIFGIYIHNLKDFKGYSTKGSDPFVKVFGYSKYKCYDPQHLNFPGMTAYNTIQDNITNWIELAILNK